MSDPSKSFLARFAIAVVAVVLALAAATAPAWARSHRSDPGAIAVMAYAELPPEGRRTVALIQRGGPYPHHRDDVVFGNRERALPAREHGYYREYTVATPGVTHRGARRIVAGRNGELYYTDDHYRSFRRIRQ